MRREPRIRMLALLLLALALPGAATALGPLSDAEVRERVIAAADYAEQDAVVLFEGRFYEERDGLVELRVQRLCKLVSP